MELQIDGYEMSEGCYTRDDVTVTDFTLEAVKIVTQGTEKFKLLFYMENEIFEIIMTRAQLNRKRFFNDVPVSVNEEDEAQFYASLRRAVLKKKFTEKETVYETGKNGLQEVGGETLFVFTNGSISKTGFHSNVYSGVAGAYFPEKAVLNLNDMKQITKKLFEQYNRNAEVFYPLFLYNIMSLTNRYFRDIGEHGFMKLTLWLDEVSGSGKTELAKCAGNYVFSGANLDRELVSATCRRKYALERLSQTSGTTFILDDVKKEAVRERKNSVRNVVDDCIRSVFKGGLTDVLNGQEGETRRIDACAVITGEFMQTVESLNARLFYLKVDGFLKKEENSDALRVLQEHPLWLSAVCCGYIQWMLKKTEESSFGEFLKARLRELRAQEKVYAEIDNAERLNENRHMLEMAAVLAELYFREACFSEDFLARFGRNARRAIKKISDDTYCLLGGAQMVFIKILENICLKSEIRKAVYRKGYHGLNYCQVDFCIWNKDDFVWIDDYQESLRKNGAERYSVHNQGELLLIRESRFMELFQAEIQNLLAEDKVSSEITDKLHIDCKKMLREMQVVFKQYRTDSKWGRFSVEYPVFEYNEYYYHYGDSWDCDIQRAEETNCMVESEPVMQINTSHPCIRILKERMEEGDAGDIFNHPEFWRMSGMRLSDIWQMRKSFTSGKELYRK